MQVLTYCYRVFLQPYQKPIRRYSVGDGMQNEKIGPMGLIFV